MYTQTPVLVPSTIKTHRQSTRKSERCKRTSNEMCPSNQLIRQMIAVDATRLIGRTESMNGQSTNDNDNFFAK